MPGTYVALIRGINVGTAKRVAMADLRALVGDLGYGDVRTLLNSGNVVFTAARGAKGAAARIERAMAADLGVSARVRVLSAAELATIIRENPLGKVASDPSRLLVTILTDPADRTRLRPLARRSWAPEAFAVGRLAAYTWCPAGLIRSAAATAAGRLLGDAATSRNWATMLKLQRLLDD